MKILLTFALLFGLLTVKAQTVSCSHFRDGKFKTVYKGITAIIYRKGSHQYEFGIVGKDTIRVSFMVKWVDDCTYMLIPDSEYFKQFPKMPKNALLTVKMSELKEDSYIQTTSLNFSNKTFTSEMTLLPNN